jgi:hypothetical protein
MKMPSLRMTQTLISAEALVLYLQTQSSWNVKAPFLKYHLYIIRGWRQGTTSMDYISYRVTSDSRSQVTDFFKGCCCVIAEEFSCEGVQHYHIVVHGHAEAEMVKKRITRAKLGVNKWWSKKNHGNDFMKAISYTVKCGEYWTRKRFHEFVEEAPDWVPGDYVEEVPHGTKDMDRDWLLTRSNLLRVAQNWRSKHHLKTDKLGEVLDHMEVNSRWIPSPQILKTGLDPWYHTMFAHRISGLGAPPAWWEPKPLSFVCKRKAVGM